MHTVDHAGSSHRHCKTSVHTTIKEADRREPRLVFMAREAITLVACLCCVNGEDLVVVISPENLLLENAFDIHKPKKPNHKHRQPRQPPLDWPGSHPLHWREFVSHFRTS